MCSICDERWDELTASQPTSHPCQGRGGCDAVNATTDIVLSCFNLRHRVAPSDGAEMVRGQIGQTDTHLSLITCNSFAGWNWMNLCQDKSSVTKHLYPTTTVGQSLRALGILLPRASSSRLINIEELSGQKNGTSVEICLEQGREIDDARSLAWGDGCCCCCD